MKINFCTLTGVDEQTDQNRLVQLSQQFPFVEWGFLYSPSRAGEPGRYASVDYLRDAMISLPPEVNMALHVCGKGVDNLLANEEVANDLVSHMKQRNGRIQLNFNQRRKKFPIGSIETVLNRYSPMNFIVQFNEANQNLPEMLFAQNLQFLVDASGGNGISPESWPAPLHFSTGYAGGLGPLNVQHEMNLMSEVAGNQSVWIDMEGKIRKVLENGVDVLDLDICEEVLQQVGKSPFVPFSSSNDFGM